MRRCLAIVGVFPPAGGAGALRMVKLFKYLRRIGWQIDVVAPRGRPGFVHDPSFGAELDGLRVERAGLPVGLSRRLRQSSAGRSGSTLRALAMRGAKWMRDAVALPDEYVLWAAAAARRALQLAQQERYDLLLSTSFPYSAHLAALAVARKTRLPWWVDLRDPWVGNRFRRAARALREPVHAFLESRVLASARWITVVSQGMRDQLAARYAPSVSERSVILPNGYDSEDFEGAPQRRPSRFEILYTGSFDHTVSPPDPFLESIARVIDTDANARERLRFRVVGSADLASGERIARWRRDPAVAEVVTLESFEPHRDVTRRMASADGLALSVAQGASWHVTAKVYEYIGSGRPILAAVPEGDCRRLLDRCGGAAVFDPHDISGLAETMAAGLAHGKLPTSNRQETVAARYSFAQIARQAEEMIASC